jgi:hypothetical protein
MNATHGRLNTWWLPSALQSLCRPALQSPRKPHRDLPLGTPVLEYTTALPGGSRALVSQAGLGRPPQTAPGVLPCVAVADAAPAASRCTIDAARRERYGPARSRAEDQGIAAHEIPPLKWRKRGEGPAIPSAGGYFGAVATVPHNAFRSLRIGPGHVARPQHFSRRKRQAAVAASNRVRALGQILENGTLKNAAP